jgi:hypothetical protein
VLCGSIGSTQESLSVVLQRSWWPCVLFLGSRLNLLHLSQGRKEKKKKMKKMASYFRSISHEDGMELCLILRHQPITPLFFHGNHLAREYAAGEVDCSSVCVSFQVRLLCSFILSQPFQKITCLYHT